MYEIESSTGYVLSYYNVGEADRRYKILTPTHGVVIGSATSVRKEKSKLKYFLQRYNYVEFEYIHGKGGYRFTGGQLLRNPTTDLSVQELSVLARVTQLVERLTQDQDEETDIFTVIDNLISELSKQGVQTHTTQQEYKETLSALELWGTARVLVAFGYFDVEVIPDINPAIYTHSTLSNEDVVLFTRFAKPLERYIRQCIIESML